jgi:hypothetical protein
VLNGLDKIIWHSIKFGDIEGVNCLVLVRNIEEGCIFKETIICPKFMLARGTISFMVP